MCGSACEIGLNDAGQGIARAIANAFADQPIQAVVSSPLRRARETAAPLAQRLGITAEIELGLAEVSLGEWEGLTPGVIRQNFPSQHDAWRNDAAENPPPGGESLWAVCDRVAGALARLRARYPDGEVVIITHKTVMRIAVCMLTGIDIRNYRRRLVAPLGSETIIDYGHDGPLLRLHGSVAHLPPALRNLAGS